MADDEKREEQVEGEEKQDGKEAKAPKKASKLMMIIGIAVVVLLLGGGGAAFYFFGMAPAAAEGEEGEEVEEVDDEEISETDIYFTGFNSNVVNLAVSDEYDFMYLKYGFDVEVSEQAVVSELGTKLPRLIGVVAMEMSNQDYLDICSRQGHERLIRNIIDELNESLDSGTVIGIHFHTFVAQ